MRWHRLVSKVPHPVDDVYPDKNLIEGWRTSERRCTKKARTSLELEPPEAEPSSAFDIDGVDELNTDPFENFDGVDELDNDDDIGTRDAIVAKLQEYHLMINQHHHLIICTHCHKNVYWKNAWTHCIKHLKQSPVSTSTYPSKTEILTLLCKLGACTALMPIQGPIDPIPELVVVDAVKCGIAGCLAVCSSKRRLTDHSKNCHPGQAMICVPVRAQAVYSKLSNYRHDTRAYRSYVEVNDHHLTRRPPSELLAALLSNATRDGLYASDTLLQKESSCNLASVHRFRQCLQGVDLNRLRAATRRPNEEEEPEYIALLSEVKTYYSMISSQLITLSVLTLRCIATKRGDPKPKPFGPLQERDSLNSYASYMGQFIIFLMRHRQSPVPGLQLTFHENHVMKLSRVQSLLASQQDCQAALHELILSLLTQCSPEHLENDWKDQHTLFLTAYHMVDKFGNMTVPSKMTSHISAIQWCYRATAAYQVMLLRDQYNGNTYE